MDLNPIIEHYQQNFSSKYASRITRQQKKALGAILSCRTERFGKMQLECQSCDYKGTAFHSCGHRSCHNCQHHETSRWLDRQNQKILPVDYFMVTFTLPFELRSLAWHNQKEIYQALFSCAISTLKTFGINDKKLGADTGGTAVLHTHSRQLNYHPHLHIIVPGGCLDRNRKQWKKLKGGYLFNAIALAKVFRARFLETLNKPNLSVPPRMPTKWVVHCKNVGRGLPALKYLSRYLYRGVISENNIINDTGTEVTFRYKDSKTDAFKTRTVRGKNFL